MHQAHRASHYRGSGAREEARGCDACDGASSWRLSLSKRPGRTLHPSVLFPSVSVAGCIFILLAALSFPDSFLSKALLASGGPLKQAQSESQVAKLSSATIVHLKIAT